VRNERHKRVWKIANSWDLAKLCWTCHVRSAGEDAVRPGASEARILPTGVHGACAQARCALRHLPRSRRLRTPMDAEMHDVLDALRRSGDDAAYGSSS